MAWHPSSHQQPGAFNTEDVEGKKTMQVVPGIEPGFPEGDVNSESDVITATPYNRRREFELQNIM